jgi:pimeloyl-ACP methyl ester carboxylesterase
MRKPAKSPEVSKSSSSSKIAKSPADAAKPTLIFLHGFRGDHHGVRFVADYLRKYYRILTPDLPPFGAARALARHDLDTYSQWLRNYIETACPDGERPILVAHSMGTIIATHYAAQHPETISPRLILISPISRATCGRQLARLTCRAMHVSLSPLSERFAKRLLASHLVTRLIYTYLTTTRDHALRQRIRDEHLKYSGQTDTAKGLLEAMELALTRDCLEFGGQLRGLHPTIIIGDRDQLTRTSTSVKLVQVSEATFHLVPGTGHLIIYEKPHEVATLIRHALAE